DFGSEKKNRIKFEGVLKNIARRYNETSSDFIRETLEKYMAENPCPTCNGYRLREEALSVLINEKHISELTQFSVTEVHDFFNKLTLTEKEEQIARLILKEINDRLQFLMYVGLNNLTMENDSGILLGVE